MAHDDPLAEFRHERWQKNDMAPKHEPLTEHQALRLAINALHEIPHSGRRMEGYSNASALIPELEPEPSKDIEPERETLWSRTTTFF